MQYSPSNTAKNRQSSLFVYRCIYQQLAKICVLLSFSVVSSLCFADYLAHPKAKEFIAKMHQDHGFAVAEIQTILGAAQKKQAILDAIARPAEKTKEWFEYRKIFIQETRIDQGVEFWQKNAQALSRAQASFGVAPEIIVAIIGVETRYGRHMGTYRVVDALATLGFDYPSRSGFFSRELEQFLLLAREQKQDPLSLTGSYAGAMGYGQFIPSSYRAYAVDFDGDKFADIWHNPVDAIGSVANYFRAHKWRKGEAIVMPATASKDHNTRLLNSKRSPQLSLAELKENGFAPADGASTLDLRQDQKAIPLRFVAEEGTQYWLGFTNFYVITRYNRSHLYAMAVYELSQAIKQRHEQGAQPQAAAAGLPNVDSRTVTKNHQIN